MKRQKVIRATVSVLALLIILVLHQNCGDIRLKHPNDPTIEKLTTTTTTTLLPIDETPQPSPNPSPSAPVVSDEGLSNPSPIVINNINGFGNAAQSIFINGHWVVVGTLVGGSGTGGMWILKEDGSLIPSLNTSVKKIDLCTSLIANYMAANGYSPPNCKFRNSIDDMTMHADGHDLYKINDSEFLFLVNIMGESQPNPNIEGCNRTAVLRMKLEPTPLKVSIQSAAVGCFTSMTVLNNQEVLLSGQLARSDEPRMIHSYNLSDLSYVRSVPMQSGFVFSGPFTLNTFAMFKPGAAGASLLVRQSSTGDLVYNTSNEDLVNGWSTDDPLIMATYTTVRSDLPSSLKFYRETAPGVVVLERTESIPVGARGRNRQGFHYTLLNSGEWAYNRGSYLKIGTRPGVEAPRFDLNPGDIEQLIDVNINSNGYIIFVYFKEIHLAKIRLN